MENLRPVNSFHCSLQFPSSTVRFCRIATASPSRTRSSPSLKHLVLNFALKNIDKNSIRSRIICHSKVPIGSSRCDLQISIFVFSYISRLYFTRSLISDINWELKVQALRYIYSSRLQLPIALEMWRKSKKNKKKKELGTNLHQESLHMLQWHCVTTRLKCVLVLVALPLYMT